MQPGTQPANHGTNKLPLLHPMLSWTDDLPVCDLCGYGSSTNQIYRQDGVRRETHEFEDRSFHFCVEGCYLYGVFDGHNGSDAAHFAEQRIPAEVLLGQLTDKNTNTDVKDVILQAFEAVERGYFESIDDLLAAKAKLLMQVTDGVSVRDESDAQYKKLEASTSSGCSAAVALIHNNRLYVANCGNSRVLLCRRNQGKLRVQQLTVDHTIWDSDEQDRLSSIGVDMNAVLARGRIGNMVYTRCLGDYKVKMDYKDIDYLSEASRDPVSSIPFISDGIDLDDSCQFLILMTDGLYTSLQDATDCPSANAETASMVASEFRVQSTLNGVSQAVVDKVVRIHHDTYMTTSSEERKKKCQIRDDLTLLVRNFNCQLAPLPTVVSSPPSIVQALRKASAPSALSVPSNAAAVVTSEISTNDSTSTMDSIDGLQSLQHSHNSIESMLSLLKKDESGRVGSYVNFDSYFEAVDKMTDEEKIGLEETLEIIPDCPPIREENENQTSGTE